MSAIRTHRRRSGGLLLLVTLLFPAAAVGTGPLAAQQEATGTLSGLVLDPEGDPVEDFRLVFRDDSGLEHVTEPSDKRGNYSIDVPAGQSYQLVAALSAEDERLEVPALPPIPVNGGRRLDVRISHPAASKAGSETPWVQIGAAAGAALVLILAVFDDDSSEKTGSPFVPRG